MARKRLNLIEVHSFVSDVSLEDLKAMNPREVARLLKSRTGINVYVLPGTTAQASLFVFEEKPKKPKQEKKKKAKVEDKKTPNDKDKFAESVKQPSTSK